MSCPRATASNPIATTVTAPRTEALAERSTAASGDEDPVWIGGSRIARKGPVVGLLGRVFRIAVNDAAVHRAGHIDLVRHQLDRNLCCASQQLSLNDISAVKLQDPRLKRLFCRYPLVDRRHKLLEHLVTQQRPQASLIAVGKRRDNHIKGAPGALKELSRFKARVGTPDLI